MKLLKRLINWGKKSIYRKNYKVWILGFFMEDKMIRISVKEYEGMKETIEILQDPDMMDQILESEKNIREGKVKELKY